MSIKVVSSTDSTEAVSAENAAVAHGTSEDKNESSNAEAHAEAEETESQDEDESARESEAGDDEESDTEEEESQDEKPKKRRGYQRRVDKLKSRLTDREREIEFWKQKALSATPPKQDDGKSHAVESKADGRPSPDDYELHADYIDALTEWKVDQKLAKKEAKEREAQVKTEHEKRASLFQDKVKTFAETKDDFEDVIEAVDDIPMSVAVQEVILDSDIGPELMYELAKDKDEYARICKLTPLAAARELGKIEARLSKSAETKQTSKASKPKAPPPLTPVGSKSSGSKKSFDPNWSQSEYERWREAQDAKRA